MRSASTAPVAPSRSPVRHLTRAAVSLGLVLLLILPLLGPISPGRSSRARTVAAAALGDEVIVVLADGADPWDVAQRMGITPTHVYTHVFTGFAGRLPDVSGQSLELDPDRGRPR